MYLPFRSDNRGSPFGTELLRDIEQVYRGFRTHVIRDDEPADRSRRLGRQPGSKSEAKSAMNSIFTKDFLAFVKPYDAELPEDRPNHYYAERECENSGTSVSSRTTFAALSSLQAMRTSWWRTSPSTLRESRYWRNPNMAKPGNRLRVASPAHVFDPVGRCIYCGRGPDAKLTKEHIIPYGLNGHLILPAASCEICAAKTSG